MSDTLRTDAEEFEMFIGVSVFAPEDVQKAFEFARQFERELNALNQRIERMEEIGNELRDCASRIGTVASGEGSVIRRTQDAIKAWDKEAKL